MKPKPIHAPQLALFSACAFLTHVASAQTWQTVGDFQYPGELETAALCVALDPVGNLFVGGWLWLNTQPPGGALIQKSSNGGATWSLADYFPYAGTGAPQYLGITSDSSGNLYGVGVEGVAAVWFTRQSLDSGATWNTVDAFGNGSARAAATDAAGNVYVVGRVQGSVTITNKNGSTSTTTTNAWLVRKGTNLGSSWSNVDSISTNGFGQANAVLAHPTAGVFVTGKCSSGWLTRRSLDGGASWMTVDAPGGGGYDLGAVGIGADASGSIYAVGQSSTAHWLVRKSGNGGTSWATVDDFYPCVTVTNSTRPLKTSTQCYSGRANGFAADAHGNLFAVGYLNVGQNFGQWVVRENPGGNTAWQTVDVVQYAPSLNAEAWGIAADSLGSVYVTGVVNDGTAGGQHWIVRKN